MDIKITGTDEFVRALSKIERSVNGDAFGKAIEGAAKEIVLSDAKRRCPVRTGRLKNSISSRLVKENGAYSAEVYTDVPYASYVEFGTGSKSSDAEKAKNSKYSGIAPQPYMYPALLDNESSIIDYVSDKTRDLIEGG